MVVVWGKSAKAELRKAFEYIALDSRLNAEMVKDTLIDMTIDLLVNPDKHPLDKFKTDNDGSWRAFEKFTIASLIVFQRMISVLYVCVIPVDHQLIISTKKAAGKPRRLYFPGLASWFLTSCFSKITPSA